MFQKFSKKVGSTLSAGFFLCLTFVKFGAKLPADKGQKMKLKKIAIWSVFSIFLISGCVLKLGCNFNKNHKAAKESDFRKYPIEKFINYRLNTPYWNLPKVQDEKHALKTEIRKLHSTVAAFNEKKLTTKQAYEEIISRKTAIAGLAKMAFRKYMPDGIASPLFENENYRPGTDSSKAIYKYRLPTLEETENDKLWDVWIQNRNLYVTSIWIMDSVLEHAYIEAVFELKELGVPNSYLAFNFALNGELERMSELMQKY